MFPPWSATIWPKAPSWAASMAAIPKRVARMRSKAVGVALLEVVAHPLDVELLFGDEDLGRPAGDARLGRDPPGVAPHDLHHHDPVMGLCGGVQTVDRVGGDLDGSVETERHLGARQVV